MLTLDYLLTSLVVVLIPGTGVIYTLSTGLFMGARASIFASLGCTVGILPSLLASILGLAVIMHTSAVAFQIVKYAGVAYLLYMAWSMWKNTGGLSIEPENQKHTMLTVAAKGFLLNILNPKLSIFFLAFIPQFIPTHLANPTSHMMILGAVFMLMTFVVFVLYGLMANAVRQYLVNSKKVTVYIQRVFAGSFALLGLKLAMTDRS